MPTASLLACAVDTVLGFDHLDGYASRSPFFGCIVGRHSGRLEPSFTLDGVTYALAGSDGGGGGIDPATNLHGGKIGWNKRVWRVSNVVAAPDGSSASVTFGYGQPILNHFACAHADLATR